MPYQSIMYHIVGGGYFWLTTGFTVWLGWLEAKYETRQRW